VSTGLVTDTVAAVSWAEHAVELARLEDRAHESARTLTRRRLAVEQARAAVPDRGRFLTSRLYPSATPVDSD
jgi:hypothetical protein